MFYAIQTAPSKEHETKIMIEKIIEEKMNVKSFFLTRDMRKKYHGKWITIKEKMYPGYIFIETDDVIDTYLSSYTVPLLTKFLGREGDLFISLNDRESNFLSKLISAGEDVPVSKIDVTEGNKVVILSEPLSELEGYIKKIDLHRRIAEVEVEFMGRTTIFHLGIEFVKRV